MKHDVCQCYIPFEPKICRLHGGIKKDKNAYFDKSQYELKWPIVKDTGT